MFVEPPVPTYDFTSLAAPIGASIIQSGSFPVPLTIAPGFYLGFARTGLLGAMASSEGGGLHAAEWREATLAGSAVDTNPERARQRAIAEAAERLAATFVNNDELVLAPADALEGEVLDLDLLPRCSSEELADPRCPLCLPSKAEPIRWIRAMSLLSGQPAWVPLVMSHLYIEPLAAERFWAPISTGMAAHTDPWRCMFSAICEVIERDAVALTWLARLPLPEVLPPQDDPILGWLTACAAEQGCSYRFFNATTDLGVPTLYGLRHWPGHPRLAQLVGAASDLTPEALPARIVREMIACHVALDQHDEPTLDVEDFFALPSGALHMGRLEQQSAFDFLTSSAPKHNLADLPRIAGANDSATLAQLIERLRTCRQECYLVDLTTDEQRSAGLWVMRAIMPGLMPMCTVYRARFLGTKRLAQYATRFLGRTFTGDMVNPAPQPFS